MIRGRKEKEVRIFISLSPICPSACLWLLAVASFLYLRAWLRSDNRPLATGLGKFQKLLLPFVPSGLEMVVVSSCCEFLGTLSVTYWLPTTL